MPATPRSRASAKGSGLVLADDPVVVDGDPRKLTGSFRLRNAGGDMVTMGPVVVRDPAGTLGLTGEVALRTRGRTLGPDAEVTVPIRLRLDRSTPPGEYRAEVDVAGTTRELVVQVTGRVSVDLDPRRVVVPNRPGAATVTSVVVTNRGNVPVVVGEIGAVPLDDEQRDCRILRRTVDALTSDKNEVSVERLLTELTRASKDVLDRTGLLRVRNLTGSTEVPPGATTRFDLEVEVPSTLDPHARYTGFVPVATRTLTFVVVPGLPGGDEPKPKRTTRRRTTTTTTTTRSRRSGG